MFRNIGQKLVSYTPTEQANNVSQTADQPVQEKIDVPELKNTIQSDVQNTSIRAEMQIAGMNMQTLLNKNLDIKLSLSKLPFQKDEGSALKPIREKFKPMPTEIFTGAADDKVEINKGSDNLVHLNVNGTEIWSGTDIQFKRLRIDTGEGDDQVINSVDGAKILTGAGKDDVTNLADNARIDTGDGDDEVQSKGSHNKIETGHGDDIINNKGAANVIHTGSGEDKVGSRGDRNQIELGDGSDVVDSSGDENHIFGGRGNDTIVVRGEENYINGNENDDNIELWNNRNYVSLSEGKDDLTLMYNSDDEIARKEK
jgi:hypothetical protein